MSCGTYCYHNRWVAQPGRLLKLTKVQNQPGPTRDYGSSGALSNSIRRRVMRPNKQASTGFTKSNLKQTDGYGPLFGTAKAPGIFDNCSPKGKNYYRSNGGTSSDVTYWKKIAVGPRQLFTNSSKESCSLDQCKNATGATKTAMKKACGKVGTGICVLGGKKWLQVRRGLK
mgnify:CR=1 FL=1